VSLVEQELLTLPECMSSPSIFRGRGGGVRVARSLVFCVAFRRSLFDISSFFQPLWGFSVLRFTDSDYLFGIFRLFLYVSDFSIFVLYWYVSDFSIIVLYWCVSDFSLIVIYLCLSDFSIIVLYLWVSDFSIIVLYWWVSDFSIIVLYWCVSYFSITVLYL
jgi:hypothetical protein